MHARTPSVEEEAHQKNAPQSSDILTLPYANHLSPLTLPLFCLFFFHVYVELLMNDSGGNMALSVCNS